MFAFSLALVTHCTRLGLDPAGSQTVVFEDLHGLGHAADLVLPSRACYRHGKMAIRELHHRCGQQLDRLNEPSPDCEK